MNRWAQLAIVILLTGGALTLGWFMRTPRAKAPTNQSSTTTTITNDAVSGVPFSTIDLPDRDARFDFRLTVPSSWAADDISQGKIIRFYSPSSSAAPTDANVAVLLATTLPTSTSTTTTVDTMSVHWFDQQSESNLTDAPTWLATAHTEAWVAVKAHNDLYYVFAQGPNVTKTDFQNLVDSLHFGQPTTGNGPTPQLQ